MKKSNRLLDKWKKGFRATRRKLWQISHFLAASTKLAETKYCLINGGRADFVLRKFSDLEKVVKKLDMCDSVAQIG